MVEWLLGDADIMAAATKKWPTPIRPDEVQRWMHEEYREIAKAAAANCLLWIRQHSKKLPFFEDEDDHTEGDYAGVVIPKQDLDALENEGKPFEAIYVDADKAKQFEKMGYDASFPIGSPRNPVDNLTDALKMANERGLPGTVLKLGPK